MCCWPLGLARVKRRAAEAVRADGARHSAAAMVPWSVRGVTGSVCRRPSLGCEARQARTGWYDARLRCGIV